MPESAVAGKLRLATPHCCGFNNQEATVQPILQFILDGFGYSPNANGVGDVIRHAKDDDSGVRTKGVSAYIGEVEVFCDEDRVPALGQEEDQGVGRTLHTSFTNMDRAS